MLDAIVCPDWEFRYYSYNSRWAPGEEMASMRNGSGDDWFLLFGPFGAGLKGLAHEYEQAGDADLLNQARSSLPAEFKTFLDEPAFGWEWMSFCYWRRPSDSAWERVIHPEAMKATRADGSSELLLLLYADAQAYVAFAEDYYEVALPKDAVEAVFRLDPLTDALVRSINPELTLAQVVEDAHEIGYLVTGTA